MNRGSYHRAVRAVLVLLLLSGGCSLLLQPGDNHCGETCADGELDAMAAPGDTSLDQASNKLPCLNAAFGAPEVVTVMIDGLAETDDLASPSLTGDMDMIYFNVVEGDTDIWEAQDVGAGLIFGPAAMLSSISDNGEDDEFPKISEDGSVLRFVSDRVGTGDEEVYESQRQSRLVWGEPALIKEDSEDAYPPTPLSGNNAASEIWSIGDQLEKWKNASSTQLVLVNALGQVKAPWLSRDGLVLLFALEGQDGGLRFSVRASVTEPWSAPQMVPGLASTSLEFDSDPWLAPDLCTLYFGRRTRDEAGSTLSRKILRARRSPL